MANSISAPKISLGDYIVIQRQKYTKLQKFSSLDGSAMLGKEQLLLAGLLDQPYSATFKMCPKESKCGGKHGRQRLYTLELCGETELRDIRNIISASGADNRNINDGVDSQTLKSEDIEDLRDKCPDSSKLIEKIVENSKTFNEKTEYSQEKYLKKKEKKYFEFVQIRKPTIRLLTEIFYRQDADKVMGIRMDTLSQIISYSGISSFGNYLLYESGTNGLLPASFLNAMGAGTESNLVYMHPGNVAQKQAILALNLPNEQLKRCISVNIYSVLREYYQGGNDSKEIDNVMIKKDDGETITENNDADDEKLVIKKAKLDDEANEELSTKNTKLDDDENEEPALKKVKLDDDAEIKDDSTKTTDVSQKSIPIWQLENQRACKIMHEKFDSLVIAAKEHPTNILKTLLPLVKASRPILIFSLSKEILMEIYVDLKSSSNVTNLHLTSNWLRILQILPNRTHPEVNMNGNSGYLLSGYTVS